MAKRLASLNLLRAGRVYTAYDICAHVATQILEEPKRLDMDHVLPLFKGQSRLRFLSHSASTAAFEQGNGPACGTAACIAGWIGLNLHQSPSEINGGKIMDFFGAGRPSALYDILYDLFYSLEAPASYGTKAYARHFVKRLRWMMKENKAELQARRIKITTAGPVIA